MDIPTAFILVQGKKKGAIKRKKISKRRCFFAQKDFWIPQEEKKNDASLCPAIACGHTRPVTGKQTRSIWCDYW